MKRLVCLLRDLMKTLILGGIISIGIAIVIGVIALLVNKGNIKTTIEVIRSALLITGSFGLLLSAILIIKKNAIKLHKNQCILLHWLATYFGSITPYPPSWRRYTIVCL